MKKRMMMLLTTAMLVMGLTACGDSTASTGNDAASNSTSSLATTASSEATPTTESTPETIPEPTPIPEPAIPRDFQTIASVYNDDSIYRFGYTYLIDGEYPDTSVPIAEMYFNIPEGSAVTYDDLVKFTESLKDEHSSVFELELLMDNWDNIEERFYERTANAKKYLVEQGYTEETTAEGQKALLIEFIHKYSCEEAIAVLAEFDDSGNSISMDSRSEEIRKYGMLFDVLNPDLYLSWGLTHHYEIYQADPSTWIDMYLYFEDWESLPEEEKNSYRFYDWYLSDRLKKELGISVE